MILFSVRVAKFKHRVGKVTTLKQPDFLCYLKISGCITMFSLCCWKVLSTCFVSDKETVRHSNSLEFAVEVQNVDYFTLGFLAQLLRELTFDSSNNVLLYRRMKYDASSFQDARTGNGEGCFYVVLQVDKGRHALEDRQSTASAPICRGY